MTHELTTEELRSRVLYALLLPMVRLAANFGVPLAQMKKLLEMAYYHETRRRGLAMRDAMDVMGVSISKAALLSRQLKDNFLDPERELELPRRVEYMLWAEPLSRAKLGQALGSSVSDAELDEALTGLERGAHVVLRDGLYHLNISQSRRVWDTWLARLDGLNNALGSVADAVFGRFFRSESPAFARTVNFHIRHDRLGALRQLYEEQVWPRLVELDAEASEASDPADVENLRLSVFWAPLDLGVDPDADTENDS